MMYHAITLVALDPDPVAALTPSVKKGGESVAATVLNPQL